MSYGLERVTFAYGDSPVLEQVTWTLPQRGVVCLWGESGGGKTTILRLLAGLERPAAGTVRRPERVSLLFQENRLLPWYTALENVMLPPDIDRPQAEAMLAAVGLSEERDCLPDSLSGGQRRRIALARALALPGELLLLDEPFTGLDEEAWRSIVPLVLQQAQEIPVVLVTHVAAQAEAMGAAIQPLEQLLLRHMPEKAEKTQKSEKA